MKNTLLMICTVVVFYYTSTGFYDSQVDGVLEDGTYSYPRILCWLPQLVGIKNYFVIMSVGVGLTVPLMIVGFYYIIKDEWVPDLKSRFGKK